jgi:hypothetical protein
MLKHLFAAAAVIAAAALIQPADAIAQPNQPKAAAKAAPRAAAHRAAPPRAAAHRAAAPRAAARAAPRAAARPHNFARSRAVTHQRAASPRPHIRARAQAAHPRNPAARQAHQNRHDRRNAAREANRHRGQARANQARENARAARQQRREATQSREERRNARQERREQRRDAIQNRQDRRDARQDRQQRRDAAQERNQRLNAQQLQQGRQNARQERREQRQQARQNQRARISAQQARQGRFAARFARQQARANRVAFRANRWAWRHHRRAGFVPWYGPVFWPYAYSDIFGYTFWADGYEPGYWAYAYDDFFDGVFWGYEGAPADYVYAPDEAPSQASRSAAPAKYATARQLCKQPGSGITAWPFADITKKVNLNAEQKDLLGQMKDASKDAAKQFTESCPAESNFATTPPGRLDAMTARLDATLQAVETVRPALERFYASLSDEQKERFNEIGPDNAKIAAAAKSETQGSGSDQAASCGEPKPGLSNLPIERIEDTVKPDDSQEAKLKDLETATNDAVGVLQAACPDEVPMTPPGRLDAMEKRLKAMVEAANTVKPSLGSFYNSLNDEQKARFNKLGREIASSND